MPTSKSDNYSLYFEFKSQHKLLISNNLQTFDAIVTTLHAFDLFAQLLHKNITAHEK